MSHIINGLKHPSMCESILVSDALIGFEDGDI